MKTAALHDLGQLDAWVLSTYQRLERMDVPVFDVSGAAPIRALAHSVVPAVLRRLPTALPARLGDFGAWLATGTLAGAAALDTVTRLSLLLRYLAAPLRYEPGTESPVHKAVPSARGLFPVDYYLLERTGGTTRAWRYVPEHHALTAVDLPGDVVLPGGAALVAVAQVWRIAEKYGEFAHFPPVLEAGHAAAQTGYLAMALGLAGSAPVGRDIGRGLCRSAFDLPLFAVDLTLADFAVDRDLPAAAARLTVAGEGDGLATRFPRLATFHRLFDGGDAAGTDAVPATDDVAVDAGDFLDVLRRRTAGNDRSGVAATLVEPPAGTVTQLFALARRIAARRPRLAGEAVTAASLAWLAPGPTPAGLYAADGTLRAAAPSLAAFHARVAAMLPYRGMRYNVATLTATLVVHSDPLAAIERLGPAALREVHLAAGAIAHDFSLAATALGMFARPVRMMREASLEAALPIDGQVVYQLLCGFARRGNMSMELL